MAAGWSVETVDPAFNNGAYADLAFNSYNQPYISYYDANQGALKIATRPGNSWEYHILNDGAFDVGRFTSIEVDSGPGPRDLSKCHRCQHLAW